EKEVSHGRVSWQDCWRSFPQGYSLRYHLQLLLRPLKVLLHSCSARRCLLPEISVTSVGVEKLKLFLHHGDEAVEDSCLLATETVTDIRRSLLPFVFRSE